MKKEVKRRQTIVEASWKHVVNHTENTKYQSFKNRFMIENLSILNIFLVGIF